ncbi:hypothetical protein V1509DRAFT_632843 [Lipomyces kononenkoae]
MAYPSQSDNYLYDGYASSGGPYPDSRTPPQQQQQQLPRRPGPHRGPPPPPSHNYNYPQQYYGPPGPYRRGPPRPPQPPHGDSLTGVPPARRVPPPTNAPRQRQPDHAFDDYYYDDGGGGGMGADGKEDDDVLDDDYSSMISDDLGGYDSRFPPGGGGALSQLKMQQQQPRPLRRPGGMPQQRPPPQKYHQQYRTNMEYMNGGMQRMDINGGGPPPQRRGPPMRAPPFHPQQQQQQQQYHQDEYYYGNGQRYIPAPLPPPHARGMGMPRSASGPIPVRPPPPLPVHASRRGSDSPIYDGAVASEPENSKAYSMEAPPAVIPPPQQQQQQQQQQQHQQQLEQLPEKRTIDIGPSPSESSSSVAAPVITENGMNNAESVDDVLDMYMDDAAGVANGDPPDESPINEHAPELSEEEQVHPSNSSNSSSEFSEPRTASPYAPHSQPTRQPRPTPPAQFMDDQEYYSPKPPMTMVPPLLRKPMSQQTFAPRPASPHLYAPPPHQQGPPPRPRGPIAPVRGPPPSDNQQFPPQQGMPGQGYRGVQQPPLPVPGRSGPRDEPDGAYVSPLPRAATFDADSGSRSRPPGPARAATYEFQGITPPLDNRTARQPLPQQVNPPRVVPSPASVQSAAAGVQNKQPQPSKQGQAVASPSHPAPVRQYSPASAMAVAQSVLPPDPVTVPTPLTQAGFVAAKQRAMDQKHNAEAQLAYAKALLEASSSPALTSLSGKLDTKATRKNIEKWTLDAQKIVKKLATASNPYPEAVYFLGTCYGTGGKLGLEPNHEKEYEHYKKASKLGHARASYRTAVCYELGSGTRRDDPKAWAYYKQGAQQGDTGSMYKIGMVLLRGGLGQAQSTSESLIWLKRAVDQADAENPHALYELARLYETADGSNGFLVHDDNLALEMYGKAAALGYLPAQYKMGAAHEYGHMGCSVDPQRSIAWYSRAAQKGDAESELGLSGWYLTGADDVLPKSETESYLWARRSSEKGLAKAQYAVGYFMENGIGTTVNMHEAIRWYKKAAAQNYPKAMNRLRDLNSS